MQSTIEQWQLNGAEGEGEGKGEGGGAEQLESGGGSDIQPHWVNCFMS